MNYCLFILLYVRSPRLLIKKMHGKKLVQIKNGKLKMSKNFPNHKFSIENGTFIKSMQSSFRIRSNIQKWGKNQPWHHCQIIIAHDWSKVVFKHIKKFIIIKNSVLQKLIFLCIDFRIFGYYFEWIVLFLDEQTIDENSFILPLGRPLQSLM